MSEFSYPWTCTEVGDGASYSVEMIEMANMFLGNMFPEESGIVYWKDSTALPGFLYASDNLLEPINSVGNTITIGSGVGFVKGWVYINAENPYDPSSYDVSGGNANAVDIIGLRLDISSQTVRLFHGRGDTSDTYELVQTTAIWEIPIVEVTLDGSGDLDSIEDVRTIVSGQSRILIVDSYTTSSSTHVIDNLNISPRLFSKLELEHSAYLFGGTATKMIINNDSNSVYNSVGGANDTNISTIPLYDDTTVTVTFTFRNDTPSGAISAQHIDYSGMMSGSFGTLTDIPRVSWNWYPMSTIDKIDQIELFRTGGGSYTFVKSRIRLYGII